MVPDISELVQARRVGEKEHQALVKLVACNKRASTAYATKEHQLLIRASTAYKTRCLHVFVPICMCALLLGFVGASVC